MSLEVSKSSNPATDKGLRYTVSAEISVIGTASGHLVNQSTQVSK